MILVLGGFASGRHTYCSNTLCLNRSETAEVTENDCALYTAESSADHDIKSDSVVQRLCSYKAVIALECGCGVIPLNEKDHIIREKNGRLNCALALRAEKVIRIVCGIPQVIKE
jgi:adenosyl cobinamide kinase/adenosyl cobinamide phosphate guanylyltransferase